MVSLKLKQKLLLLWFGSILFSLLLLGAVFLVLNNELHQNAVHQQMAEAFDDLNNQLEERNQYLVRNTRSLAARKDIVASLSMIHNYQDPADYQSIIFDTEKKKLGAELLKLLRSENVNIIAAYDGHMRLSSFAYFDEQRQAHIGYLSYKNGISRYFISDSNLEDYHEVETLPLWLNSAVDTESEISYQEHVHAHGDSIIMGFHLPVVRQLQNNFEETVGLITVDELGSAFAEDISKQAGLGFMFSVNGSGWVSAGHDIQNDKEIKALSGVKLAAGNLHDWQMVSQGENIYGITNYSLDDGKSIKFVFVFGASELRSDFTVLQQAMILVLLVNILLLLPLGIYFLKRTVLRPVADLVAGIESLSEGHYKQLSVPPGKDEMTFLANSFNSMAHAIQMRETELQKLSLAVEQSPVSMIITNLKAEIEYVNPTFTKVTGYNFDEVVGKSTRILQGGETPIEVYQQLWQSISNGQQWRGIFHNRKKNGDLIWESTSITPIKAPNGEVINYLALSEDITQRKQTEEQLYLQSAAMKAAADGIVITDRDGSIQCVNPAYEIMTGYTYEEVKGKNPRILKSDRQDQAFYEQLWQTILSGKTWQGELYNKRKDGSIYLEEESITPVLDESGEITHFVAIKRDITAQRQQEEQLRHSQKMDALGKLTGGIAHDYNNMLGVILGYSDVLEDALSEQPKLAKYAYEIHRAGERGVKLTKKLLAFSRQKISEADVLNLNMLLQNQQHMLEKTLTARIQLTFNLADDLWPIWVDSGDLEDAIINMSINAMHAMEGNGRLIIQTHNEQINALGTRLLGLNEGDYVTLSITDTGCGMDESTKEKIFDPFYSTKGEHGTGLGLSQVYGFVERSGGIIKVYSELDQGTRFTLYFPRYQESGRDEQLEQCQHVTDIRGNESILVVDDEPALLDLNCEVLSQQNYNVFCAESAKQALDILEHESIDLLLSDVIMPEMDGYQLASIVREKYPAIKIQMVSGFSDDRHLKMVDDSLHENSLQKPLNSKILLQRIRTLLDDQEIHLQNRDEPAASDDKSIDFFEWTDQISVGVPQIDQDHKVLISFINRCIAVMNNNEQDNKEIRAILNELVDYTQYHFQREELLMKVCQYPDLLKHQQGHQLLIDEVGQRIKEYGLGELTAKALFGFLTDWLTSHIMGSDKAIAAYCEGKESRIEQALKTTETDHPESDK
ncbi:MAG: bacteriohemerythrin [Gammaproteobacteria bacterium]